MTEAEGPSQRPYERDRARVLAMYRVPSVPVRSRVLELCASGVPILATEQWNGGTAVTCRVGSTKVGTVSHAPAHCRADLRAGLPFTAGSFDLVMMHETLDHLVQADRALRRDAALDRVMCNIVQVLSPQGVLAGCVANRFGIGGWRLRGAGTPAAPPSRASFTARSCAMLLRRAGLTDIHLFNVVPSTSSPYKLFSTDRDLSRQAYTGELEAIRAVLTPPGYFVRRAMALLALNRYIEDAVFFWGHRA